MKKPIDTDIEQLWKVISEVPINAIQATYKEYGLGSLTFNHKGDNYLLSLKKVVKRKNKLKPK